ncbi:alr0857 family protein [Leptolyngbya sp. NIES-2104]|uniref:alr0857 family protein n=1 Tax=Leptolyngbya sp. NIES-2104 TaxID=1552121 RepID=UPI0006EC63E3|nr:alr0857 family protein [Leptolyngbya sp. NIES-2104]GAP94428.1 hypothetical protein NIES2104_09390 [Leptolyngbya sp. NIES-2104]
MLKLTYTEFGLHLERVTVPLETLVSQRVVLALRMGQTLHVEPSRASFLLSIEVPGFGELEKLIRLERIASVSIVPVDDQFVEVSVQGHWIANTVEAHSGVFVTALGDRVEFSIYKLWQATQLQASPLV